MTEAEAVNSPEVKHRGWQVVMAGLGINLALGVLYSWSVISDEIAGAGWSWSGSAEARALPYSLACLVFCLIMVPAGRMQDKLGPRLVATIGGVLVGSGMILASIMDASTSSMGYIIGFGILAGAGIGFGYASATPPAVKWFPKAKTGLIAGLVVCGFGLSPAYSGPLASKLATTYDLKTMMLVFGVGFLIVVAALAQLLKTPPAGYVPEGEAKVPDAAPGVAVKKEDFLPSEMLKTWQFYILWFMYACGAGAGLMIISLCKKINAKATLGGASLGIAAVVALSVGNGGGRVLAGMISDKIGRKMTMFLFFVAQAVVIVALALVGGQDAPSGVLMLVLSALVGANYGSNLALFPSATKDYFGLKNFGMNYGLVFTSWGVGGFILAQFAAKVYDGKIVEAWKGSYKFAFFTSAALLIVAAALTFVVKAPHHKEDAATAS